MQSFVTFSDLKNKPLKARLHLSALGVVVVTLLLIAAAGFGGNAALRNMNNRAIQSISEKAVTQLINTGSYTSIKPYVHENFLGVLTEAQYDESAKELTQLKGSNVATLSTTSAGTFGTIKPKDSRTQGNYLFSYFVTVEKTGLNSYKVTNIVTDYGQRSFLDPDRN